MFGGIPQSTGKTAVGQEHLRSSQPPLTRVRVMVCQPTSKDRTTTMNAETRLKLGVALLVIGLITP